MSNRHNSLRKFGKFSLEPEKKLLWFESKPVNVTLKEIEILCVLTETSELVTKEELLDKVWADSFVEESNLSKQIYRLRKMFAKYGEPEDLIETVPKRGYRWTGEIVNLGNSQELVIEKHSITRTVVEEIEHSNESNLKVLPPKPPTKRFLVPILLIFIIATLGIIYLFYARKESADINAIKTIAVLPLKNYKENSKDETLPIRIADAVITRLGTSNKIIVRPTNAVVSFTGDDRDAVEIGKKLQTDAVLDGRIQQENDKLRITLQLINVADGRQLWSGQIDGFATQILLLQDDISLKVLEIVDPTYKKETELASVPTNNPQAYEAYLQGRYYTSNRTEESLNKAIEYFQKSVEIDPNFAEGYAGLADAHFLLYDNGLVFEAKQVETAKVNLQKALSLKSNLPDALVTLGHIQMNVDWDWQNAEKTFKKVIEISPNNSNARLRYGMLLNRLIRFEEAHTQLGKAIELDPTSLMSNIHYGVEYYCKKDYEAAIKQYKKVAESNPKFAPIHWWLSRSLWLAGRKDESIKEIILALENEGDVVRIEKFRALELNKTPEDFLRGLIKEWEESPANSNPNVIAYMYANIGEKERAINYLEKAFAERHPWTTQIRAVPEYQTLITEPRYQELIKKMKL